MSNHPKPILALRGYTRTGSFPIDSTSYYDDYAEALEYAQTSKLAYAGQIISVDDKAREKVRIYKIAYDKTEGAEYKYYLEEINVGATGSGYFNFKGRLDSYEELLQIKNPADRDLYYVKDGIKIGEYVFLDENTKYDPDVHYFVNNRIYAKPENIEVGHYLFYDETMEFNDSKCLISDDNFIYSKEYSAYIYKDNQWAKVDLGIGLASKTNDGLMSKELYTVLAGNCQQGILYNPGWCKHGSETHPEDSSFIPLITSDNFTGQVQMLSEDKIKELLYSTMEATPPKVEIKPDRALGEVYVGEEIRDLKFDIYFYHNLAGAPKEVIVESSYLDEPMIVPTEHFIYDSTTNIYIAKDIVFDNNSFIIQDGDEENNYIKISLTHEGNQSTLYPETTVENYAIIKIFDRFLYSFGIMKEALSEDVKNGIADNVGDYIQGDTISYDNCDVYFAKNNYTFDITLHDNENGIAYFTFLTPIEISEIVNIAQNDIDFLSIMEYTTTVKDNKIYHLYTKNLMSGFPTKTPLKFKITLK